MADTIDSGNGPAGWEPDNDFAEQDLPHGTVTHLQAALLVDSCDKTLSATECPGSAALGAGRVIGRDWHELFTGFEQIEIEAEPTAHTCFFVGRGDNIDAYRVRRWGAEPVPGSGTSRFILIEAVGDPAATRELIYQERMASLGQIAAGVAHEVNNPLTTVSGWLQILLSQTEENDKRRGPLQLMNEETGRIANIIHHLLSFGRRTPTEQQLVRMNRLLSDVIALVEYQFRNENIEVVTQFGANPPMVMADANQLKQVLLNVIVNARQAMPDGGTLTLSTRETEEGAVEVAIGDTGCGMDDEVARKVFEPFYTTKQEQGGSGIGLFLCRNIVKDHGGTLTVSSRPGEGSTFIIRLPGARQEKTTGASTLAEVFGGWTGTQDAPDEVRTEPAAPQ